MIDKYSLKKIWIELVHNTNREFDTYPEAFGFMNDVLKDFRVYVKTPVLKSKVQHIRSLLEPLFKVWYDTSDGKFKTEVLPPNFDILDGMRFVESIFCLNTFSIHPTVVDCVLNNNPLPDHRDNLTLMVYSDECKIFQEKLRENKAEFKNFLTRNLVGVAPDNCITVYCDNSVINGVCLGVTKYDKNNTKAYKVNLDDIIYVSSRNDCFNIMFKFKDDRIMDSTSVITPNEVDMDLIYGPWGEWNIHNINSKNHKMLSNTVNTFLKIKHSNMSDDLKIHIAVLFQDPRVVDLISDDNKKQLLLEKINNDAFS